MSTIRVRFQITDEARQAERESAERIAKQEAESELHVWIDEHGSDFLKKAVGAGYDCQKRYVLERVAVEHPGATLDYLDNAAWKSRSCPSEAALDLALKIEGEVVWLTAPPLTSKTDRGGYYEDDFEACEAVVIRGYLGKYDVVYTEF